MAWWSDVYGLVMHLFKGRHLSVVRLNQTIDQIMVYNYRLER